MLEKPSLAALIAAQAAGSSKSRRPPKRSAKLAKAAPPAAVGTIGNAGVETKQKRSQKPKAGARAVKVAPARVEPPPIPPQNVPALPANVPATVSDLRRDIFVRRFITEYLRNAMKAGPAYRALRPHVSEKTARTKACELLKDADVHEEFVRQTAPLREEMGLNQAWVIRQWAAMASANILDYVDFDAEGRPTGFNINPARLTLEQKQNIQELCIDPKTGKVTHIELVRRSDTVRQVAQANKMFRDIDAEDLSGLAQQIAERMQRASKLLPRTRTFDGDTGEEIDE